MHTVANFWSASDVDLHALTEVGQSVPILASHHTIHPDFA